MLLIENIPSVFKLPITYTTSCVSVHDTILNDIELINNIVCNPDDSDSDSESDNESLYNKVFTPNNDFCNVIVNEMGKRYTSDKSFLKETQKLITNFNTICDIEINNNQYEKIIQIWNDIKENKGFNNKYYYIDYDRWTHLNKSELCMQCLSMYNIFSPVLSLIMPLMILIIPFFIMKIKGLKISVSEYIIVLKVVIQHNSLGNLFTNFSSVSFKKKIYLFVSALFYIFSIYQNFITCIKFNKNMKQIHEYLFDIQSYIQYTTCKMKSFIKYSRQLYTYDKFNNDIDIYIEKLDYYNSQIEKICEYKFSINKLKNIGHVLKTFYVLHNDDEYTNTILYSFGINAYIDSMRKLNEHINNKHIMFATFVDNNIGHNVKKNKKYTTFNGMYYGHLFDKQYVSNNIKLNKHMIITGPNASGKTTLLKSLLINIIITQQFGCGFYKGCNLNVYDYLHCYLNIPDTSGRDSLFQAEARRCKKILDCIKENGNSRHLCIFDELYSGTNPTEAIQSGTSFLNYLTKHNNVMSLMTTHYTDICKKMKCNKKVCNYKMNTELIKNNTTNKNDFKYTYLLKKGVSKIHGGVKVLIDMDYPTDITMV
jgi:energy-coupling factor transporter ATP-binding protein EcfA2